MRRVNRFLGYLASCCSASLIYMVWLTVQNTVSGGSATVLFNLEFAFFFWLVGGMAAALVLLALPWCLVVVWHDRVRRGGLFYFALMGAMIMAVMACAASSLAPKPLFVDDQTFLEGFVIAVHRQGVCLVLAGVVFGMTYWFMSERLRSRQVR